MNELLYSILTKEKIKCNEIKKSEVGFSNLVYFIDDLYVIKILEETGNKAKFENEIAFYKNISLSFIPKYISSGVFENTAYLIIEKIMGDSLYDIWHTLSRDDRTYFTVEIAKMLKQFNKINKYDFLHPKYIRDNSIKLWTKAFQNNIKILKEKGYDSKYLESYLDKRVKIVFKEQKLGLVYNDAHFDNFIYDGEKLYLIDFDRIQYTSIDYEMLILSQMVFSPTKFASEKTEPFVDEMDYLEIIPIFMSIYPELFDFEHFQERLYIYTFFYKLSNAYTFNLNDLIVNSLKSFQEKFYNK